MNYGTKKELNYISVELLDYVDENVSLLKPYHIWYSSNWNGGHRFQLQECQMW